MKETILAQKIIDLAFKELQDEYQNITSNKIGIFSASLCLVVAYIGNKMIDCKGGSVSTQKKLQYLREFQDTTMGIFWDLNRDSMESHSEQGGPAHSDKESWEKARMDSEPQ